MKPPREDTAPEDRSRRHDSLRLDCLRPVRATLDGRLATYLSAGAATTVVLAPRADAEIVVHTTPIPFGINGTVPIDFNDDGQIDFQIDHDRVDLNGVQLDYLQLDKNDASSAETPLPITPFSTFGTVPRASYDGDTSWTASDFDAYQGSFGMAPGDIPNSDGDRDGDVDGADFLIAQRAFGVEHNYDHAYVSDGNGFYVSALTENTPIGPDSVFDFSETDNAFGAGTTIRANRLIDEDMGQIDEDSGATAELPFDFPHFTGLGGEVRYVGVKIDLNDAIFPDNVNPTINGENEADDPANYNYGWIGIQIDNEADATGVVTGYAYETTPGMAIPAGAVGLVGASAVPEPTTLLLAAAGGVALLAKVGGRRREADEASQ